MSLLQKFMKWANDNIHDRDRLYWYSNTGKLENFGHVLEFFNFHIQQEIEFDDGSVVEIVDTGVHSTFEHEDTIPFVVSYKGQLLGKFGRYNSWDEDHWDNEEFVPVEYQTKEIVITKNVSGWFRVNGDDE